MSGDIDLGTTGPVFQQVRHTIIDYLDSRLVPLGGTAGRLTELIGERLDADAAITEDVLAPLTPQIESVLAEFQDFVGHGFVAAPGVVMGRERYLLWLQRRPTGVGRLNLNLNPDDPDVYDYLDMEWFTRARSVQAPAVYGPYIDYAGSDHLVLTEAVPVLWRDAFVGVIGADILADEVEGRLVQHLNAVPSAAIVVNADRSVVASNSARWMPGERLDTHPSRDRSSYAGVGTLGDWAGWVLAVASA